MRPRFSIVIPTRNRAETLRYTLQNCLAQSFESFEIVVCDNNSTPETKAVVEQLGSSRVRYYRSSRTLSMTDSWEFALENAAGEFVIFVGSDDCLLLHALREIDRLLLLLKTNILRWDSVCYNWPNVPKQEFAAPNSILIPLSQESSYYPILLSDATLLIQRAVNARLNYAELPMVQCSAVSRDIFDSLRRSTGRVFWSRCPDIYSSFALGMTSERFYSVRAPMTINGLSGESNGVACIYLKGQSAIASEFVTLNRQDSHACHPTVPDLPVMPAYIADSFLHAKQRLCPSNFKLELDRKQLVINCFLETQPLSDNDFATFHSSIRGCLKDDPLLTEWYECTHAKMASLFPLLHTPPKKRYGGDYLFLNGSDFEVTNIHEAALLCEKILGCDRDGINAHIKHENAESQLIKSFSEETLMLRDRVIPQAIQRAQGLWSRLRSAVGV